MPDTLLGILVVLAVASFVLAGASALGLLSLTLALGFASAVRVIWARWPRGAATVAKQPTERAAVVMPDNTHRDRTP
jgi:uncharacterized protein (DUF58 family)